MATTTLVCKQCNFENEPERVYCHNCGAKLDRSLLPPEASKREDPVLVQERVRKMVKPRNVSLINQFKNLLYSISLAAVLAIIVVIIKPPDGLPNLDPSVVMDAPSITDDMDAAMQNGVAQRLTYKEDQVNAFLQSSLHGTKGEKAGALAMTFERVFIHLGDGVVQATTQQSLFGLSVYATTDRTFSVRNGVITSKPTGGSLGRLPIPARAMPVFEVVFQPVTKALDRTLKLLGQMQAATVRKGSVELITPARR